jgi:tRNA A37 threonylcarbamoyladenosine modification protein TsaB
MILALRSDKPEAELYLFDDGKKVAEIKWEAHRELADTILGKIKEILVNNNIADKDITGIIMHTGEGSFTGLRIGTTVANAMSYSLGVPIVAAEGENWINEGLGKITSSKPGNLVVPKYNAEPNISQPKDS